MNLYQYFLDNKGPAIHKNLHYFPIYERHFGSFVGKSLLLFEIGVWKGGSARMWKRYFGPRVQVVGIDINPSCLSCAEDQIAIRIGDQSDEVFLTKIIGEFGVPDIVLDDGSHVMSHIRKSFDVLYPKMARNGVYFVEDLHTAYWGDFEGGLRTPGTFIEHSKCLIDKLNGHYTNGQIDPGEFGKTTSSIHFYDSVVVFEKGDFIQTASVRSGVE